MTPERLRAAIQSVDHTAAEVITDAFGSPQQMRELVTALGFPYQTPAMGIAGGSIGHLVGGVVDGTLTPAVLEELVRRRIAEAEREDADDGDLEWLLDNVDIDDERDASDLAATFLMTVDSTLGILRCCYRDESATDHARDADVLSLFLFMARRMIAMVQKAGLVG